MACTQHTHPSQLRCAATPLAVQHIILQCNTVSHPYCKRSCLSYICYDNELAAFRQEEHSLSAELNQCHIIEFTRMQAHPPFVLSNL